MGVDKCMLSFSLHHSVIEIVHYPKKNLKDFTLSTLAIFLKFLNQPTCKLVGIFCLSRNYTSFYYVL